VLAGLLAGPSGAAVNLVENAGFDDGLAGWMALGSTAIEHDATDELGSPASGSMRLTALHPGQTSVNAAICVPVVEERYYALGSGVHIPAGQLVESPRGTVSLFWSSTPDCSILDLGADAGRPYDVTLLGVWGTTQRRARAPLGALSARFQLQGLVAPNPQSPLRLSFDNTFFLDDATCAPTHTTLCLNGGRFRVTVGWSTVHGDRGLGQAAPLTDDAGYFWFFDEANVELVAKLLDACATGFHSFWFFAAGLTDVETEIHVHDTLADLPAVYFNPQKNPFAPIQDTAAFTNCP
jgi:hypothetical protein